MGGRTFLHREWRRARRIEIRESEEDLVLTFVFPVSPSLYLAQLYGPLLLGASTVIFEGKPILPDAGILWRTISSLGGESQSRCQEVATHTLV